MHAVRGHGVVAGRQLGAVDDEQDVRGGRPLLGAEPGSFAQVGGQHRRQLVQDVDTIRLGPTASDCWALWPWGSHLTQSQWARFCSVVSTATTRWSGAWNAVAEQIIARASERAGSSGPQTSIRSKARRSTDAGRSGCSRCTTSSRCSAEAAAGSTWSMGALSGGTQLERERLVADAVADVQEPRVAAAVLPDPGAVLGDGGQRGRVGVVPGERPALLVGGLAGELADVAEVAEVLGAGAGDLLDPLLALPVDLDDDEAERGEQEHARRDVLAAAGAGAAHRRDEHDRAERAEHRDRVHQHAAGALGLLDLRRWLQLELAVGQLRLVEPAAAQRAGARSGGLRGRAGGGQSRA